MNIDNLKKSFSRVLLNNYSQEEIDVTHENRLSIRDALVLRQLSKDISGSFESEIQTVFGSIKQSIDKVKTAFLYNSPLLRRMVARSSRAGEAFVKSAKQDINNNCKLLNSYAFNVKGINGCRDDADLTVKLINYSFMDFKMVWSNKIKSYLLVLLMLVIFLLLQYLLILLCSLLNPKVRVTNPELKQMPETKNTPFKFKFK